MTCACGHGRHQHAMHGTTGCLDASAPIGLCGCTRYRPNPVRFRLTLDDGSTVTVVRRNQQPGAILSDYGGWRRVYGYVVRDADGKLILRQWNLYGPCGRWSDREAPTAREMTESLLSFLAAAGEHYVHAVMYGHQEPDTYRPDFTLDADQWAYLNSNEIGAAQIALSE